MVDSIETKREAEIDSTDYYVEEMAHQYYTDVNIPLPPAPPPPKPPKSSDVSFSFDPETRVVLAKFSAKDSVSMQVEEYLMKVMERTDLTLVIEGLVQDLDTRKWQLRKFGNPLHVGNDHVKVSIFRPLNFDDNENARSPIDYNDTGKTLVLSRKDYVEYLKKRAACIKKIKLTGKRDDAIERFVLTKDGDANLLDRSVNCVDDVFCARDMDLRYEFTDCYHDFQKSFRLRDVFPGTRNCLTHYLPTSARPALGPMLSISPGMSEVSPPLRQCSLDTGTLMVDGEDRRVVLLRRLPNNHALAAVDIFNIEASRESRLGVANGRQRDSWPPPDVVKRWNKMNYYPSVFILKKGQYLHINKGRLFSLNGISEARSSKINKIVNWNWAFIGTSPPAINREVSNLLVLNNSFNFPREKELRRKKFSGAPIELSVLQTARVLQNFFKNKSGTSDELDCFIRFDGITRDRTNEMLSRPPSKANILDGILPTLVHIISQHCGISRDEDSFYSPGRSANTLENTALSPIDPYGSGGFSCILCMKEISNLYYHCIGCETLLNMDFNICNSCHRQQRYLVAHKQHSTSVIMHSANNHTGHLRITSICQDDNNSARFSCSSCGNSKRCEVCHYCPLCSCSCHSKLEQMCRIMPIDDEFRLLKKVKSIVRSADSCSVIPSHWAAATTIMLDDMCGTKYSSHEQRISDMDVNRTSVSVHERNTEAAIEDNSLEQEVATSKDSKTDKRKVVSTISTGENNNLQLRAKNVGTACKNGEQNCEEDQPKRRSSERNRKPTSRYSESGYDNFLDFSDEG